MDLWKLSLHLWLVGLLAFMIVKPAIAEAIHSSCPTHCGNVSIPYPFGVEGCHFSSKFLITCNDSFNPPQAFLRDSNIKVTNISINGEIEVMFFTASACYDESRNLVDGNRSSLTLSKFEISKSRNKFTVIGCDSYAYLQGYRGDKFYSSGCMSTCADREFVDYTSCSGSGCCQIEIPDGLYNINVTAYSFKNYTDVSDYSPCTFAFIVEETKFIFSNDSLKEIPEELPMVLDWTIDNSKLDACKDHAILYYAGNNASGYLCRCKEGYSGNPYLGCEDIDECDNENLNSCTNISICNNLNGSYNCTCPMGYHGDGKKGGVGCTPDEKKNNDYILLPKIMIGVGIGLILLVFTGSRLYVFSKKRKLLKLKEKFFRQNGGIMLQQKLCRQEGTSVTAKIFTAEELKKATNNYDDSRIIGKGGFGTVYRGVLMDKTEVAIKKSIKVDETQIEQFTNEVVVLSQINHRNVVRILGCCLETEVPLIVYEFINNGTLCNHIHDETNATNLSWSVRLRIAAEAAGALSHLHSEAVVPIIHRDVKTANILVDDKYTAKVSDFGASRLVPLDEMQLTTIVQGTLGYLDPEYMRTSQLTEKSDVYSFGVVLVELLTREMPLSFSRSEPDRNLAMYFLSSLKRGYFYDIVDKNVVNEENEKQIMEVAQLAKRCLSLKGEERPSMKEVAMELHGLQREMHSWVQKHSEETEHLLRDQNCNVAFSYVEAHTSSSSGYDSIKDHLILPVSDGR